MRRFFKCSFFLYFVLLGTSSLLNAGEENESNTRYLIPQKKQERSTYDTLTEERGTLKLIKEKKERAKQKEELGAAEDQKKQAQESPTINFNNVSITEVLKYVSRLTGKNFIYDPQELQFNITMISDTPSSLEEIMAMVIQSVRVHGFTVLEEGGSYVIHTNPAVRGAGALYQKGQGINGPQLATEVFLLQNIDATRCSALIKTMISDGAIVETVGESKIIVSDYTENLKRISDVIKQLDSESEGLEIGQYVAVSASPTALAAMAERLVTPMAGQKALVLVPHPPSNSVFIVSTSFLIDKAVSVMKTIDLNEQRLGKLAAQKGGAGEQGRPLTPEEELLRKEEERRLQTMTDDQLRRRLIEQGLSEEEVNALTPEAAREAYKLARREFIPRESELPIGTVEATQFLIYKLQYRKNTDVTKALKSIAESLAGKQGPGGGPRGDIAQSDLVITLDSLQNVDDNNTIVFTGTKATLEKVKNLVAQIDVPVRQVFIEALVLDTTLQNSLQFGVQWGGKIQRKNLGASVGFRDPLDPAFGNAFDAVQQNNGIPTVITDDGVTKIINQLAPPPAGAGFSAGFLGRKIKFMGKGFRSTGALVQALQSTNETHIIMNPKIITEHNVPAEVFVGQQIPIKGQTIANSTIGSTSSVLATNYNLQEIGVSLKVTPLISSTETVTLIIDQNISTANQTQVNNQGQQNAPPATVNKARTTTRVHLPSDHFLVLSGLITEEHDLINNRIPCLGGLPLVGALFGTNTDNCEKRNLMIFMRPVIIDNEIDIDEITKNQDLLMKQKSEVQEGRYKEFDTIRAFLNLD